MTEQPYDRVTWRGKSFDRLTVQAIEAAEALLGYRLTVVQGSYNGGTGKVSASAGTHDGGGAVDFAVGAKPDAAIRALRTVGFAAWIRDETQGPWSKHIHAVLAGNTRLAPSASRQVDAYRNGRDGLKSNKKDPTWRPDPLPVFRWKEPAVSLVDDLDRLVKKHGITRVYLARVCLNRALNVAGISSARRARLAAAATALRGMDAPKKK